MQWPCLPASITGRVDEELLVRDDRDLIVRMAQENPSWGYDPRVGRWPISDIAFPPRRWVMFSSAMASPLAPQQKHTTRWRDFIRANMEVCSRLH
jgi:hypothetical protein